SLEDITIFGESDDIKLADIFLKMKDQKDIPDPKSADGAALRSFFADVAPDHDADRVYSSDIKKIISWFKTISVLPLFTEEAPDPQEGVPAAPETSSAKKPEPVVKEKAKGRKAPAKTATRVSQKSK